MLHNKFPGGFMAAHEHQGDGAQKGSHGEHQINWEDVAENSVNHGGQRGASDTPRTEQAKDAAPVILRQSKGERGAENAVAQSVSKACNKRQYAE